MYEIHLHYKPTNKNKIKKPTNLKAHIVICADFLAPNERPELSATLKHSPVSKS